MKYCSNCGTELQDGAKFCSNCGKTVENIEDSSIRKQENEIESKKADEKAKEPDNKYRGSEIRLCNDGKYRWVYELNMITNPIIAFTVLKIFAFIVLGMWFIFGVCMHAFKGDWDGLWGVTQAMLLVFGILIALAILSILLLSWIYGGKYVVLFEMDEKGVAHIQMQKQYKKAQVMGWIGALAGAATANPTVIGSGILAASKQSSTSSFEKVRKVKPVRWLNVIKVNQLLNYNQVYVPKEDFDFVYNFIKSHCPKAK